MARKVRLDFRGVGAVLRSTQMHATIAALTDEVADNVRAQDIRVGDRDGGTSEYDLPVKTGITTTDRAHGVVTLAHPSGQAVQAKHGALTKAASQAGLDVRAK